MCHQADVSQMMAARVTKRLPDDSLVKRPPRWNKVDQGKPSHCQGLHNRDVGLTHPYLSSILTHLSRSNARYSHPSAIIRWKINMIQPPRPSRDEELDPETKNKGRFQVYDQALQPVPCCSSFKLITEMRGFLAALSLSSAVLYPQSTR